MITPLNKDWRLALVTLAVCSAVAVFFFAVPGNNLLVLAAVVGIPVFFAIAAWRPEMFLVGCAFMPQWKDSWPLDRFAGVGDLTLVMLLGLVLGIVWRSLRHVGRLERDNLSQLFRGQWFVLSAYALFAAAVLVSYTYTSAPNYGGVKLIRFLLIGSLYLYSGIVLVRGEEEFRRISSLFVLAACVTAFQMIFHLKHRAVGAETDITRIGAGWLLGMSILLLLCYPIVRSPRRYMVCVVLALPLLAAGLIASASRGPMVSLAIALPLTLLWFSKRQFSAARIWVAALLVASCVVSFLYLRHADPDKYDAKLGEMIHLSHGESGAPGSGAKRINFYGRTLAAIPDNLWLGQGVGSWSVFYYGKDTRDYPHNLLLETTFEEGVVGVSLFLLFLVLLAFAIRRMLLSTNLQYGVLAGLLTYCVSVSMFSGDLDDNRILWLWTGIILAVCRNAYLQRRSYSSLQRYNKIDQNQVRRLEPAQSIFARPQAL